MIYEATISYNAIDKNGNDKNIKQSFLLDNKETFTEVEDALFDDFGTLANFDVAAIKRSKFKEIANKRKNEDERIWEAVVKAIFTNDDGEETEMKYKIALFAKGWDNAMNFITEYLRQDYNMKLISLKETKFSEVL